MVINFGNLSSVSDSDDVDGDDDDDDDDDDNDDDNDDDYDDDDTDDDVDTCRQQRSGRSIVVAAVARTALHKPEKPRKIHQFLGPHKFKCLPNWGMSPLFGEISKLGRKAAAAKKES